MKLKRSLIQRIFIMLILYGGFVSKILSAYPPNYEQALQLFQKHQYEKSLEKIREVFDNYKDSLEFRLLAASNYLELKNYHSALAHLKYAIQDHPDAYQIYILMSEVYLKKGQPKKALHVLFQSYHQFKNNPESTKWIRYQIAKIFLESNQYKKARKQLEILIAKYPDFDAALYLDGTLYLKQKNYELAEFRYKTVLSLKSVSKNIRKRVYNNLGFLKEIAAMNLPSTSLERLQLKREAKKLYRFAFNLDANYTIARENLKRLESQ